MNQPFCQSCGMPMNPEDFGTNKDATANEEYCKYCFQNGAFTSEGTLDEMIAICIPHMVNEADGITAEKAREMLMAQLPQLKRWQKA